MPKLHNAMWTGLVGKDRFRPPTIWIRCLALTAKPPSNGVKVSGWNCSS